MELEDYARALLPLCFASEQDERALPGFALYREMVRSRLLAMARIAFRRSCACVGESKFIASFERYLEATPPRSPMIREVIGEFAQHMERDAALREHAPEELLDLVRFEAAKWRVANACEGAVDAALGEVDFDAALVFNHTLELLSLDHGVAEAEDEARFDPHTLLVYRRRGEDEVHWCRVAPLLAAVFQLSRSRDAPLAELVREAVAQRAEPLDERLLEELASGLTVAVERGVLLGGGVRSA